MDKGPLRTSTLTWIPHVLGFLYITFPSLSWERFACLHAYLQFGRNCSASLLIRHLFTSRAAQLPGEASTMALLLFCAALRLALTKMLVSISGITAFDPRLSDLHGFMGFLDAALSVTRRTSYMASFYFLGPQ